MTNGCVRRIPCLAAWFLLLGTAGLFFYFPCQQLMRAQPWIPHCQGAIVLYVLVHYTRCMFMDPGVIPRACRGDEPMEGAFRKLQVRGVEVRSKWCDTCHFYRPPRSSHCAVCDGCVDSFDHHCEWINNCVGRRNYRHFVFFLLALSVHILSVFSLCLVLVLEKKPSLAAVDSVVAVFLLGAAVLLGYPVLGLTTYHLVLIARGRTTKEDLTDRFKDGENQYSNGWWRNLWITLCGPQYPSLSSSRRVRKKP